MRVFGLDLTATRSALVTYVALSCVGAIAERRRWRLSPARAVGAGLLAAALHARTFECKRGPVDLAALLRQSVAAVTAIEPRREVTLCCDVPEEPCWCEGDHDRLLRDGSGKRSGRSVEGSAGLVHRTRPRSGAADRASRIASARR